ncbi:uncharacterized protein BCR38DRAFT_169282 [Pseudomassariella vexata]|uniref:Uncharacterized protein n=1 Tax=Pseudomassariella vexata TaxID=1141098 RepID=A0A1Y2E2Z9_9PEZI|nr:uncharacterized protein BCR38DRAFT_169282 [Pseudomassariella vexata]ORY65931.1 hypothetical protein BCR38DRAFT_169282 [Pseudomassariella vexata]
MPLGRPVDLTRYKRCCAPPVCVLLADGIGCMIAVASPIIWGVIRCPSGCTLPKMYLSPPCQLKSRSIMSRISRNIAGIVWIGHRNGSRRLHLSCSIVDFLWDRCGDFGDLLGMLSLGYQTLPMHSCAKSPMNRHLSLMCSAMRGDTTLYPN